MELIQSARNYVRIAKEAVQIIPIDENKTYEFTPSFERANVRMRLIATGPNFKTGQPYVFHDFGDGEPATFNPSDFAGYGLDRIYLFTLLPWSAGEVVNGRTKLFVGRNDGERGVLEGNSAAVLTYVFSEQIMYSTVGPPPDEDTVALPGPEVEFTESFFHSIEPTTSDNWVNITLLAPPNADLIQKNAAIHLTAGYAGNILMGLIDINRPKTLSIDLLPFLSMPKININLTAFVHPETIDGEFVFQLGDPQKDGTIKMQTV